MMFIKYLSLLLSSLSVSSAIAQNDLPTGLPGAPCVRELTIEPAIGIHANFGVDFLITNLVQWNPRKHLSVGSYSSFNVNNITQRYFNSIKTEFNYSVNQKFGVGANLYSRKKTHTFLLMAGANYTRYRETLDNEQFDKTSITITSLSPDAGLLYSLKQGWKNCFFTYRMYLPVFPWPLKGSDIEYIDGNINHISLEFGLGIGIR